MTTLVVFGLVGLTAALGSSGESSEANIREIDFPIPTNQTDVELARRIVESGVTADVGHDPSWLVSRDADGSMVVIVNGLNGTQRVRVIEDTQRLRIDTTRNSLRAFLSRAHARTARPTDGLAGRLWSGYIEFSAWSLAGLSLTGLWLGFRAGRQCRLGWYAGLAGTLIVAMLIGWTA